MATLFCNFANQHGSPKRLLFYTGTMEESGNNRSLGGGDYYIVLNHNEFNEVPQSAYDRLQELPAYIEVTTNDPNAIVEISSGDGDNGGDNGGDGGDGGDVEEVGGTVTEKVAVDKASSESVATETTSTAKTTAERRKTRSSKSS